VVTIPGSIFRKIDTMSPLCVFPQSDTWASRETIIRDIPVFMLLGVLIRQNIQSVNVFSDSEILTFTCYDLPKCFMLKLRQFTITKLHFKVMPLDFIESHHQNE
jgi:hypothetical protein